MIEYTKGGVIDDHTRFLMRFNVDILPPLK